MKKIIAVVIVILITLSILPLWAWSGIDNGLLLKWLIANHVGQISSVTGVLIALIGFGFTFRAATRAAGAATKALEGVRHLDTVENLSKAAAIIEEIIRMNRGAEDWKIVLDRHLSVRNLLGEIRSANVNISEAQKATIQAAIMHSATISKKIEITLDKDEVLSGIGRMNNVLSEQVVDLNALRVEIRQQ